MNFHTSQVHIVKKMKLIAFLFFILHYFEIAMHYGKCMYKSIHGHVLVYILHENLHMYYLWIGLVPIIDVLVKYIHIIVLY